MDWVREVQGKVGLKDAPDPRPEMVRRLKAYRRLVEALREVLRSGERPTIKRGKDLLRELGEL